MIDQTELLVDPRFRLAKMLEGAPWKFASSMPTIPHEYTLRVRWEDNSDFNDAVAMIRTFGYDKMFFKRKYVYWDCNGYHHWSMGAPVKETELINRAVKKYHTVYDEIATVYDSLYSDHAATKESAEVVEMAGDVSGRTLDIGCGTGLLLEFAPEIADYVGIDISQQMLSEFNRKFPAMQDRLLKCSFEDYYGTGFNKIVALFGAANYIPQEHLDRIPAMLAPGGEAFLMFYQPDYHPVAYEKTNTPRPEHNQYIPQEGDEPYHKYMIRRVRAA